MPRSYEDRLSLLKQFQQGSRAFSAKISDAALIERDGWELMSSGSQFGMFNGALIYSGRKDLVPEVMAALSQHNIPADIRLMGPGISQIDALAEHGYKLLSMTPLMMWSADSSVDNFQIRDQLSVRRLIEGDLKAMTAIYQDVYKMSDEMMPDYKRMLFASPADHTYGLFKDDELVSLVTAMVFKDTVGIYSMGTPTVHQKNGFGMQLLMQVMKIHKDLGAKTFFLYATAAGKFLYDKAGWITIDYLPYLSRGKSAFVVAPVRER